MSLRALWIAIAIDVFVSIVACSVPLESWNPQHPMPNDGRCHPPLGVMRGPDDYDRAHGQPFHCEAGPYDPENIDVDALENQF